MVCGKCKSPDHTAPKCTAEEMPLERVEIRISEADHLKLTELKLMAKNVGFSLKKGRAERVYQNAMGHELMDRGIPHTMEEVLPIFYKGRYVGDERLDIVLNSFLDVIFELKAVASDIKPENHWQVVSYMNYKNFNYGMVVNYSQSHNKGLMIDVLVRQDGDIYLLDMDTNTGIKMNDYSY